MEKLKSKDTFLNGLIRNNPVFVLVLGMCPTLAMTTRLIQAFAMGAATMLVLICSNVMISLLRKQISERVRIPAYLIIISTFVIALQLLMRKYLPDLYSNMRAFIALIVVNCVIFARADSFASSNKVSDSALDGFSMGLGFTAALVLLGAVRETVAYGSIGGYKLFSSIGKNAQLSEILSLIFIISGAAALLFTAVWSNAVKSAGNHKMTVWLVSVGAVLIFAGFLINGFYAMDDKGAKPLGFIALGVLMAFTNNIRSKFALKKGADK